MFDLINLILTIIVIALILGLGWLALRDNPNKLTNKLFFFFSLSLALWEFFSFSESWTAGGYQLMIFMTRLDFFLAPVVVLLAALFVFSFSLRYKLMKTMIGTLIFPTLLVSILSFFDAIFKDAVVNDGQVIFQPGPAFWYYAGLLLAYTLVGLASLILKYPHASDLKKKQIGYIIFGFSFSSIAIVSINLFLQNALSNQWFRICNLSLPLILSFSMFQAIVLYNLMNIRLIMRRSLVYFLVIISILIPAGIWLYFLKMIVPDYLIVASLIILALSLVSVSKLKKEYYYLANKYFFSSLYDVREIIYNLNKALHSSLDTKQICRAVAVILSGAFHPQAIATVVYDQEKEKWAILHNEHFRLKKEKEMVFDYEILTGLFRKNRPLLIRTLEQKLAASPGPLLKYLKKLKVEIIVPIKTKNRLIGLLLLGAKEARDNYTINDLKVLMTVSTEIGLAMENVLLYQKEKKFNYKLRGEINKATRQLQNQNQELQRLDMAKDEFVSVVSHQLRTPLTGIRWFTGLLLDNKKKNLSAEQLDFLNQIDTSNKKMIQLVNDLLDVSHIETGYKFKIVRKEFPLLPLIQEILKENVLLIKTKELKIINRLPQDLKINADRDKIKQVWQNLISNATAYSPSGKKIILAVKTENQQHIFSVQDEGIGVPKSQQARMFEKFFRAKNANLQNPNGTGLGLYIARGIIHGHGGDIWFKSTEHKGTTFFFSVPGKSDSARRYKLKNQNI